jgi:glycosyltransferase involved in cell wall biosynthesis
MPVRHVVLLTANPLHANPRVVKEASALAEAGYEVTVLGAWSGEGGGGGGVSVERCFGGNGGRQRAQGGGVESDLRLAARGGYTFIPLLPPDTTLGKLHRFVQRLARKCAPRSRWAFGLMPFALKRAATRLKPALAIAHSEPALFAALALHNRGTKVGVDMEDWFSEDLLPEARSRRPVDLLRKAERELLRCSVHATCTTEVMADALASAYACSRPTRVYNVFPAPELSADDRATDRSAASRSLDGTASRGRTAVSIHWFSQTIGPGRGLERLFEACVDLNAEFEIHLRGSIGSYGAWIEEVVPTVLRPRMFLHEMVANDELPARIAEHDIGYAGEVADIPSRNLTATNKIFQYLQGGLAVVASDTDGQKEVARLAGEGVLLYSSASTEELRRNLDRLIANPTQLAAAKSAAARIAAESLNWSVEKPRLLASIYHVLREK